MRFVKLFYVDHQIVKQFYVAQVGAHPRVGCSHQCSTMSFYEDLKAVAAMPDAERDKLVQKTNLDHFLNKAERKGLL